MEEQQQQQQIHQQNQTKVKISLIIFKLMQNLLLFALASVSFLAIKTSLFFAFLCLISSGFFFGSSYLFFLMMSKSVNVKQEKRLFLVLFVSYFVIMAILAPNIRSPEFDAEESQNQNGMSKVSESRQKNGKVISISVNESSRNTDITFETDKKKNNFNFNKFNSQKKIPKENSKKNLRSNDFESSFTSVLIIISCMISCQALSWALSTRINALPVIQFDVEADPQPEEIPMQPVAPVVEFDLHSNGAPSAQPEAAQNLIVRRMRCPPEGNNVEPREDLDEVNYEPMAAASSNVAAAGSLTPHPERGSFSRNDDFNMALVAARAAAGSHRAAVRATASSQREGTRQSRPVVANPLHQISEESSFHESSL